METPQQPRIFVQIASYRDPDCQWTIKDLFEKAFHPERIFAGIAWQFVEEEDGACFREPYRYPDQVRAHASDARLSRGTCCKALLLSLHGACLTQRASASS